MRRVRYQVACSLDGYIAGPGGVTDWIEPGPDIDFAALFAQFDTLLMGRVTYEALTPETLAGDEFRSREIVVISRTLRAQDHPGVTVISSHLEREVEKLRARDGGDIWLFGGGQLFHSLLALGQVDTVEPAILPVLLGGGVPLLPAPSGRHALRLTGHRGYASGLVWLEYDVLRRAGAGRR
jgi:dihydrofolate reductase